MVEDAPLLLQHQLPHPIVLVLHQGVDLTARHEAEAENTPQRCILLPFTVLMSNRRKDVCVRLERDDVIKLTVCRQTSDKWRHLKSFINRVLNYQIQF